MTTCKNCAAKFVGDYCNNCGQKASISRLDWQYLWHEAYHSLLHVDKGLLYTAKALFVRPADAIREYLQGKRVHHFSPFAMMFILGPTLALLLHYFDIQTIGHSFKENPDSAKISDWISEHQTLYQFMMLPIMAVMSSLLFKKVD